MNHNADWHLVIEAPHGTDVLLGWWQHGDWVCEVGPYSTGERLSNGYSNRSYHGAATHWQPLPSPPTDKEPS